jgi:hypothetical protein
MTAARVRRRHRAISAAAAGALAAMALAGAARAAPGPEVTVTLAAPALVLGVDQETEVKVEVSGPADTDVTMPRVLASAGRVEDLIRVGPRTFTGRYLLPSERFPQAAIVVAELPLEGGGVARGFANVRLRAAANPAFRTDPGASVTLRIGEKEFGPQRAQRDGWVRVPVVVPPGVGFGLARSVNEHGQATEQAVDLKLPPFQRVLVVAPEEVVAGSVTEVAVYAVEPSGMPAQSAAIALRPAPPAPGRPQPLGGRNGEARFLVRTPVLSTGARALRLEALVRDQPATATTTDVPLTSGPAVRLALRPDRSRLPIGQDSSMRVYLAAEDEFGNPVTAVNASVVVDGETIETGTSDDGRVMAVIQAPPAYAGRAHVDVEAALGNAYAQQRVPLGNLPPEVAAVLDSPRWSLTPRLGFVWRAGRPPGPALVVEALGRGASWSRRLFVGLLVGYLAIDTRAGDGTGISEVSLRQFPVMALVQIRRALGSRLMVGVGAAAGATWTEARLRSYGVEVPGHRASPAAAMDVEGALPLGAGRIVIGARFLVAPIGELSSGDEILGNGGGLIADVGYRLAW